MPDFSTPCRICGSPDFAPEIQGYGFDDPTEKFVIARSPTCGVSQIRPLPTSEELGRYYSGEYYGKVGSEDPVTTEEPRKFSAPIEAGVRFGNRMRARALLSFQPAPGTREGAQFPRRVLDIGCGRGYFLRSMRESGFECYGNEMPGFIFPPPRDGIHLLHGALEVLELPAASFDCVSIWHVLEHVQDPALTLSKIAALLKRGGVLSVAVPNFGSLQSKLFGRHWFHLDLPRHLFHFSKPDLDALLMANGLEILELSTWSFGQNLYGFIQSALNVLFGATAPNALYSFLKRKPPGSRGKAAKGSGWVTFASLCMAPLFLVPALLESAWGAATGTGASLIIYARKR